ncbi:MAG TPA: glycosyltransferase, partial [Candidatus Binataceae bacterium]
HQTCDCLRGLSSADPRVAVIELDQRSPAEARNAALAQARGEIIYFLDDDVTIAPDLFSRALRIFAERPGLDVLGGPNLTPLTSAPLERCVGQVLASPFGSASVSDRYRSRGRLRAADDRSLILCNLAIRRSAIAGRESAFRGHLVCNEENVLLGQLALERRTMLHDPELVVYHTRRGTVGGFARQIFRYGRGRCQNTMLMPSSLSPVFLIPMLFVFYLLSLPIVRSPWYLVPLAVYAATLCIFAVAEALRARSPRSVSVFLILFPTCHFAYAGGFLRELGHSALALVKSRPRSEARASSGEA